MKKFAIVLAVVAGSVSASFAGNCNKQSARYYPGQCFTTNCGVSSKGCSAKKCCKKACKPACKPVCKPVCKTACR